MRRELAPLLFEDHDKGAAQLQRRSGVARAEPSPAATKKVRTRRTSDGLPVHSFQTLLKDPSTLTKNRVRIGGGVAFDQLAGPPPIQRRAFELLEVPLR
jgi:hypothetical protein